MISIYLLLDWYNMVLLQQVEEAFALVEQVLHLFSYRDKLPRSLLPTASPNLYLVKYKSQLMKYSLYLTKYRSCLML